MGDALVDQIADGVLDRLDPPRDLGFATGLTAEIQGRAEIQHHPRRQVWWLLNGPSPLPQVYPDSIDCVG